MQINHRNHPNLNEITIQPLIFPKKNWANSKDLYKTAGWESSSENSFILKKFVKYPKENFVFPMFRFSIRLCWIYKHFIKYQDLLIIGKKNNSNSLESEKCTFIYFIYDLLLFEMFFFVIFCCKRIYFYFNLFVSEQKKHHQLENFGKNLYMPRHRSLREFIYEFYF